MPSYEEASDRMSEASEDFRKQTNGIFYEINRQLLLIATVVFTFSSPLMADEKILQYIRSTGSTDLFKKAWLAVTISVVSGIFQLLNDFYFYLDWTKTLKDISTDIMQPKFIEVVPESEISKFVDETRGRRPSRSRTIFFWIQILSLIFGLCSLMKVSLNVISVV